MKIKFVTILLLIIFTIFNNSIKAQESLSILYEQGREAFKSGNYGSSELLFRKILENENAYKDQAWYYFALSIFYQKKYKAAIFEFNRYLLVSNSNELKNKSRFWIAECLFYQNNFSKAIDEYKRFIIQNKLKDNKLLVKSLEKIGEIYYKQKRYDEAIIEWEKALIKSEKIKKKLFFKLKISNAFFLNKDYKNAKKLLIPLTKNKKNEKIRYLAHLSLGRIYQIENNYKIALNTFSKIPQNHLKEYPYYNAQYFKGICAYNLNDILSAKTFLESFLLVGKKSKWFLYAKYYLGIIIINNNPDEGIKILKQVLKNTNNKKLYSNINFQIAKNLVKNNKLVESIVYYKAALDNIDKNKKIGVLFNLGNVYHEIKQYKNAKVLFLKMIKDYPFDKNLDKMQFLLAITFLKMGNFQEAKEGFKKINAINPFSPYLNEANYFLALSQYKQNNLSKTEKLLKKYLAVPSIENRYKAYEILIDVYLKQKKIKKAKNIASILINKFSLKRDISKPVINLIMSFHKNNKNSIKYENFIIKKYPDSRNTSIIYKIRGNNYFDRKDYIKAIKYYSLFLNINTNEYDPDIFIKKAYCFYYLKNYNKTINFLKNEKFYKYDAKILNKILLLSSKAHYYNNDLSNSYKYIKLMEFSDLSTLNKFYYFELAIKIKDIEQAKIIASSLNKNDIYYPKMLFQLGNYYKNNNIIEIAKEYYDSLVTLYGKTLPGNYAYIELIKFDLSNNEYANAKLKVNRLNNKKISNKKILLTAIISYKIGNIEEAKKLTINNINKIVKAPEGEELLKLLIEDASKGNKIKELKYFIKYLIKNYSGNQHFINFHLGNYYYNQKSYQYSYYYYNKIYIDNFNKKNEVYHKLGNLLLFHYKNKKKAIKYLKNINNSGNNHFFKKAQINLAILFNETGKSLESKKILINILNNEKNNEYIIQAKNLYEYYQY